MTIFKIIITIVIMTIIFSNFIIIFHSIRRLQLTITGTITVLVIQNYNAS